MNFNLPNGHTITINEDGLSSLMLGGFVIGQGISQLVDGNWWYRNTNTGSDKRIPTITSKSVSSAGPNTVTVDHTYGGFLNAQARYIYTVTGNDVHVSVTVFNFGPTDLQPGFKSLGLMRSSTTGTLTPGFGWDQSNTRPNGESFSYPNNNVPLAGWAISTASTSGPTINAAVWGEGSPSQKIISMLFSVGGFTAAIATIFFDRVPLGGSRVYNYAYRFGGSSDYQTLLGGYKTYLRGFFPTILYDTDARPIIQFSRIHTSYITPSNPYGYQAGSEFNELPKCQSYVNAVTPKMADVNYQGIIFWQPQGIHPRGVQYRPDFNSFPAVTIPNLPTLFGGITGSGRKLGLLSRPSSVVVSTNAQDTDGLMDVEAGSGYIAYLNNRIDWALGQNVSMWYLDTFANNPSDHDVLVAFRAKVGTAITFTEHSTALSMAYSGSYEQMTWNNGLVRNQTRLILDWLFPERIVLGKFIGSLPQGGYTELYTAMMDLKITPLVDDPLAINNPSGHNPALKALVASRIGPNNRWL